MGEMVMEMLRARQCVADKRPFERKAVRVATSKRESDSTAIMSELGGEGCRAALRKNKLVQQVCDALDRLLDARVEPGVIGLNLGGLGVAGPDADCVSEEQLVCIGCEAGLG